MSVLMPGSCHIQIRSGFLVINMSPVSNVFTISDALCSMDVFCKRISWPLGVENESCESNFASQSGYQMFQLTEVKNTHCPSGKNKNKSPCHLRSLFNPFYPGDSFRGNINITSSSLTWLSVAQFRHNMFVTIHLEVVRNCFGNTLN